MFVFKLRIGKMKQPFLVKILIFNTVGIMLLNNMIVRADEVEKIIKEPDAAPGCPIPDLRFSRPRTFDTDLSTEQPGGVSADPSKDGSTDKPDPLKPDGGVAELTGGREVVRHSRYIDFDPYAWTDDRKLDPNDNAHAQSHNKHTIHRRKIRSGSHSTKSTTSSIDTNESLSPSRNTSSAKHQSSSRQTNSFEIGTNLNRSETNEIDTGSMANLPQNDTSRRRVKRKSGKTTGALSRPKGASDSGSKSTSRKKDGATLDEDGYIVHATDDSDNESVEEEEIVDAVEHDQFGEVNEVHFPAEVGNGNERKLCRIRCVQGKWVGPICSAKEEDG